MRESKVSDRDKGRRQNNGEGTMSLWIGRVLSWKGRPLASSETVLGVMVCCPAGQVHWAGPQSWCWGVEKDRDWARRGV